MQHAKQLGVHGGRDTRGRGSGHDNDRLGAASSLWHVAARLTTLTQGETTRDGRGSTTAHHGQALQPRAQRIVSARSSSRTLPRITDDRPDFEILNNAIMHHHYIIVSSRSVRKYGLQMPA